MLSGDDDGEQAAPVFGDVFEDVFEDEEGEMQVGNRSTEMAALALIRRSDSDEISDPTPALSPSYFLASGRRQNTLSSCPPLRRPRRTPESVSSAPLYRTGQSAAIIRPRNEPWTHIPPRLPIPLFTLDRVYDRLPLLLLNHGHTRALFTPATCATSHGDRKARVLSAFAGLYIPLSP
ncbi:hypothetical protein K474DRAFT_1706087 [Panus rudis PR-1116 ss-1]|nr:hypothetical protein K474DRAFT_1706087 [Panus rudis PR-1116 ss-1]